VSTNRLQAVLNNETEATPASTTTTTTAAAAAPVELHPRKRKMKPNKELTTPMQEPQEAPAETLIHPHDQPINELLPIVFEHTETGEGAAFRLESVTRGSVSDRQAPEGVVPGTTEAAARLQGLSDEQVYVRAGQHGPHDSEYFVSTDFAGPDEGTCSQNRRRKGTGSGCR
jgi:hypothetical protein